MACKTCHPKQVKRTEGADATGPGAPPQHTKRFSHHDGSVSRTADAINAGSHVSPHGHVVPEGHGAGGSVAPPTAQGSALAQAIDAYYNRTAAKEFVEASQGNQD